MSARAESYLRLLATEYRHDLAEIKILDALRAERRERLERLTIAFASVRKQIPCDASSLKDYLDTLPAEPVQISLGFHTRKPGLRVEAHYARHPRTTSADTTDLSILEALKAYLREKRLITDRCSELLVREQHALRI